MEKFLWGVSTSAFQLEGSPYADWSSWDPILQAKPQVTHHYRLCRQDLQLLKTLGVNAYRFSLEWSRIEPEEGDWNGDVVDHYQRIIDFLHDHSIEPMVTLHHFTHPRWYLEKYPWHQEKSVGKFMAFVERIASTLKDVRYWITFNEPYVLLLGGYLQGCMPPGLQDLSCAIAALKNIFTCHGKTYEQLHAINPGTRVGLAHNMTALAPYSVWNPFDRILTKIATKFYNHSLIEAFLTGRLILVLPFKRPITFEVPVKGKIDFLGVNYYTRIHLRFNPFMKMGVELKHQDTDGNGLTDLGWEIHPNGLTKILRYASRLGVPLIITENGIATGDDTKKTQFIEKHVDILEKCREESLDIRGYFYWSLMDNYEWLQGFNARFGLYEVDFDTLERKPTETAAYYGSLIRQKQ